MIGTLEKYVSRIVPWFLGGPNAGSYLQALGLTCDTILESAVQGMLLRRPLECDSSALLTLCKERGVNWFRDTEPEESIRVRLAMFRQIARFKGHPYGVMINLQPYFLPGALPRMRIVHQSGLGWVGWHTLEADGTYEVYQSATSNWNYDGQIAKHARWWLIIETTGTRLDSGVTLYDDGHVYDGGQVYDGFAGPTPAQAADMVGIAKAGQRAGTWLSGLILTPTGAFVPTGTAATLADGSTTYPVGNWGSVVDPVTSLPSRAPYLSFVLDYTPCPPLP